MKLSFGPSSEAILLTLISLICDTHYTRGSCYPLCLCMIMCVRHWHNLVLIRQLLLITLRTLTLWPWHPKTDTKIKARASQLSNTSNVYLFVKPNQCDSGLGKDVAGSSVYRVTLILMWAYWRKFHFFFSQAQSYMMQFHHRFVTQLSGLFSLIDRDVEQTYNAQWIWK